MSEEKKSAEKESEYLDIDEVTLDTDDLEKLDNDEEGEDFDFIGYDDDEEVKPPIVQSRDTEKASILKLLSKMPQIQAYYVGSLIIIFLSIFVSSLSELTSSVLFINVLLQKYG